ncbi:bifunctional riboflavin kinase/FAD synthetase [Xanthobacter tagetidis]|uniref:Riboflavin biosynthesis protein n=1 Tax=Xanthobacter tagetidis TaxID=60216 RepID=A0A3L6ZUQ6_9HYPH|nr:bifunctional riboflavin kinase/FAD synthetase [Xanthobacter tagetidis]MBB6308659.1 riboflavin kinase/FMN adenylyltransferase [Xanthobacter tagetidis]RLP71538.1 bifunctional riboflavin kinase/FAD synthetase [Xanthobacter tagetidis]
MQNSLPDVFTVLRNADAVPERLARPVLAIGNFDGVHRGHRAVIDAARAMAQDEGVAALALTFEPHPRAFFSPKTAPFRLTPEPAKLAQLAEAGLDGAVVLDFDAALAAVEAEAFVADILVGRYGVSGVAVGFDFHFGRARAGSPAFLKEAGARHGFQVAVVEPMRDEGDAISSTGIRNALAAGQVGHAAHMLGRPFSFTARVIHGDKRGRELGFPTANLELPEGAELAFGVYAVRAWHGMRRLDGVASYGRRPTFDNGRPLFEVYLFDFSGDLYGAALEVELAAYLRPELKFDGIAPLIAQMHLDSAQARAVLSGNAE